MKVTFSFWIQIEGVDWIAIKLDDVAALCNIHIAVNLFSFCREKRFKSSLIDAILSGFEFYILGEKDLLISIEKICAFQRNYPLMKCEIL